MRVLQGALQRELRSEHAPTLTTGVPHKDAFSCLGPAGLAQMRRVLSSRANRSVACAAQPYT